jgi:tetratricopeptide (TPR) repeat protein
MSVNEVALAEPFAPSVADEEVELRALCRALTLGEGFSLLFARCNQADHRRELIDKIREKLPDLNVHVIDLREPITHLLDELRDRLTDTAPDAVFVLGLEYSLRTSDEARSSPLIANLNASRNSFPRVVRCPMVLWIPEYVVTAISRGAPDFFSIRSGHYSFVATPKDSMNVVQSVMAGDWAGVQNLSLAEKQERVESIKSLLADYESLTTEKRDLWTEARLHFRRGTLLSAVGAYDEALAETSASLQIAEALGHRPGVSDSLHQIAMIHQRRGEYEEALELYERALKMNEELGHRAGVASSLHQIGMIHQDRGEYEAALEQYERSLKITEELGYREGVAASIHQTALVHQEQGEYEAALELYERSLKIRKELGDQSGVAGSLHQIAIIHEYRGEYEAALELYEQSLNIKLELGDRAGVASSLHQIGMIRELQSDYPEAFRLLSRALAILVELRLPEAGIAQDNIKTLRREWGEENFDAAWQQARGEPVPDWLK